ncbi:MAG: Porphobilinogen synthase, partial [Thermoleophilia bacterium]|nr:Porphobilinogen synthase [Thermoleophilia bacterium]
RGGRERKRGHRPGRLRPAASLDRYHPGMAFPATRLRRLRRTTALRDLVRETHLRAGDLVLPMFVIHGSDTREPLESIPGHARMTIDHAVAEAERAAAAGLGGVLLFGIPAEKDDEGSEAWDDDGIVQLAVRAIKQRLPELLVVTDVCLCHYTSHGHCGVLDDSGVVRNDDTLELLARVAVSHAAAGADVVAPSDMMDGRVHALRTALDDAGHDEVALLAYSTKFASAYYGPFRDAADSTPSTGDRRSYQMDPANGSEAVRESVVDAGEGADMLMVKPALAYLDIVRRVKDETGLPLAAYNVSGEYAMVKAAAERGWIDERAVQLETLTSMRRAGADIIITYAALEAAAWLRDG